jgi:hypothetical protein
MVRKRMRVSFDDFGRDSFTREGKMNVFVLDTVKRSTLVFKKEVAGGTSAFDFFEKDQKINTRYIGRGKGEDRCVGSNNEEVLNKFVSNSSKQNL